MAHQPGAAALQQQLPVANVVLCLCVIATAETTPVRMFLSSKAGEPEA
jgi:hypothetical protein